MSTDSVLRLSVLKEVRVLEHSTGVVHVVLHPPPPPHGPSLSFCSEAQTEREAVSHEASCSGQAGPEEKVGGETSEQHRHRTGGATAGAAIQTESGTMCCFYILPQGERPSKMT